MNKLIYYKVNFLFKIKEVSNLTIIYLYVLTCNAFLVE